MFYRSTLLFITYVSAWGLVPFGGQTAVAKTDNSANLRSESVWSSKTALESDRGVLLAQAPTAPPGSTAPPSATNPGLSVGNNGSDVMQVQLQLQQMGYYPHEVDGLYGQTTQQAVADFQRSQGLTPTGMVDSTTLQNLQSASGAPNSPITPAPTTNNSPTGTSTSPNDLAQPDGTLAKPQQSSSPETASGASVPETSASNSDPNLVENSESTPTSSAEDALSAEDAATATEDQPTESEEQPEKGFGLLWLALGAIAIVLSSIGGLILISQRQHKRSLAQTDTDDLELSQREPVLDAAEDTSMPSSNGYDSQSHDFQADLWERNGAGTHTDTINTASSVVSEPESDRKAHPEKASSTADTPAQSDSEPTDTTKRLVRVNIVDELVQELRNADTAKRRRAIWELGQRGNSSAVQPLLDIFMDADSKERSLILAAMSEIGIRVLKPMNRVLALSLQDQNSEVRKNAIRDLTRIYDSVAQVSQMLTHAMDDSDPEVQATAQWALEQLNRIRQLPPAVDQYPRPSLQGRTAPPDYLPDFRKSREHLSDS